MDCSVCLIFFFPSVKSKYGILQGVCQLYKVCWQGGVYEIEELCELAWGCSWNRGEGRRKGGKFSLGVGGLQRILKQEGVIVLFE